MNKTETAQMLQALTANKTTVHNIITEEFREVTQDYTLEQRYNFWQSILENVKEIVDDYDIEVQYRKEHGLN